MMSEIFTLPKKIPRYLEEVPLYRVSKYKTYSPRLEEARAEFEARVKQCKDMFGIHGEPQDYGTQVVFKDGAKVLEVYRPSDSFWWTDLEVAYREDVPERAKLPDDEGAKEIALNYMKELDLESKYARVVSVARTSVAISETEMRETPRLLDTEVHVNLSFSFDDYPVMGPGAKIKISMIEGGKKSNFLWFWREPSKERGVKTIHPNEALARLTRDQRFVHLKSDKVRISLEEMRFGYYALPPFEFQRFLIPVYEIKGTEETEPLGTRDLVIYTPAIELTPETIKRMGFADRPDIARILPSSK